MRFNGLFCKILKPGTPHLICKKNETLNYFRSKADTKFYLFEERFEGDERNILTVQTFTIITTL